MEKGRKREKVAYLLSPLSFPIFETISNNSLLKKQRKK